MEHWESLGIENYGIYQDKALGCFTEDPVRLVHFMRAGKKDTAVDLGTGTGIIAIYANALYGCAFTGLDTDGAVLQLARASAKRNGQEIPFLEADVSRAAELLPKGHFSVVTCNPPYFSGGTAPVDEKRGGQRFTSSREPFIGAAAALLKNGGRLYLCARAEALPALSHMLLTYSLPPKRIHLLTRNGRAVTALIECKKGAREGAVITVEAYGSTD